MIVSVATIVMFAQTLLEPSPVVDVCFLLRDPLALSGRLLRIRGPVLEGAALVGEACATHVVIDNYRFPDLIAVMPTDFDKRAFIHQVDFDGSIEYEGFAKRLLRARQDRVQLFCTLEGLYETRNPIKRLLSPSGGRGGFGVQGFAPGQLILKRVESCTARAEAATWLRGGQIK